MRRLLSVLLFVLGGWLLSAEPAIAFIAFGGDEIKGKLFAAMIMLGIVAVPLAIATVVSPGDRWQELGLTILLSAAATAFCCLAIAAVFFDSGMKPFLADLPPTRNIVLAPVTGVLNLLALTGIGWLLYRRSGRTS